MKLFFLQQWSARPEARVVNVGSNEMLLDCLTNIMLRADLGHLEKVWTTHEWRRGAENPLMTSKHSRTSTPVAPRTYLPNRSPLSSPTVSPSQMRRLVSHQLVATSICVWPILWWSRAHRFPKRCTLEREPVRNDFMVSSWTNCVVTSHPDRLSVGLR